ncbi:MAG: glycosyltransferase [Patescibacteria group bacterium]
MRLALVHDDLIQFGGAESLLLAMHEIWPQAPVFTSVASEKWQQVCKDKRINLNTSFMQKLPKIERLNRYYAPLHLHPIAFESFDFSQFDVVLSVSARFSHGVITKPSTKHICYMNSPGRMFWESKDYFDYENFLGAKKLKNLALSLLKLPLASLRMWDYTAAQRVDYFIANSKTPQARIYKYYKRNSEIIYPFVDNKKFLNVKSKKGRYYVVISRLNAWKRVDLAVQACSNLKLPLVVIGDGPELEKLKSIAGSTVKFTGYVSEEEKIKLLSECIALINTQYEDFGIVPLEAMAAGKPVIAYKRGGALETVIPNVTGTFFESQSIEELINVLKAFEPNVYSEFDCKDRAREFDKSVFTRRLKDFVYYVSNLA